jgi:hypothetical protein
MEGQENDLFSSMEEGQGSPSIHHNDSVDVQRKNYEGSGSGNRDDCNNKILCQTASLESGGFTPPSTLEGFYSKNKTGKIRSSSRTDNPDGQSTSKAVINKKKSSTEPESSQLKRKISRNKSLLSLGSTKSKTSSMDSKTLKLDEEIEKIKDMARRKQKTENLMSRVFPREIAEQLSDGQSTIRPTPYENVTIYFSDIVGYTDLVSELDPIQVINDKMFQMIANI